MALDIFPCVVFGYNRPDKLQLVLSALKSQNIDRLIVFIDGPKDSSIEQVEQCRIIAKKIDWIDAELYFNEQNYGLPGFWNNINNVMAKYLSAVFVEEDCLPMPGFYSFMRQALLHYKAEKNVFSIGGYQPLQQRCFKNYPYSLVSFWRFHPWGWSTWRDRWELINPYLLEYSELFDGLRNVPDVTGDNLASLAQACAQGRIKTWDIQVAIATLWLKKVHLFPTRGLIRNIGNDGSGVHGHRDPYCIHNKNVSAKGASRNIVWLEDVEPNGYYIKELKRYYFLASQHSISFPRKLRNRLRQVPFLTGLWRLLWRTKTRFLKPRPERLYDLVLQQHEARPLTKRALLSYIVQPLLIPSTDPQNIQFSNIGIMRSIVKILNELGYIVDVVDWLDTGFVPKKEYDLFIGHGGCNFQRISSKLNNRITKIYFSTGLYWEEHNKREEKRFRSLEERRRIRLPYDRWIEHSEEYANKSADGIICLGNHVAKESYFKFPLVINLNNAAYSNGQYGLETKDFSAARKNFLFFSGSGNVHKGLDLLLEAFSQIENANLYICQKIDKEFYKVYRHELEDYANIHLVGHIPMRSLKFYELVDKCAYVILPSCSEGCAGSVVECMHHGLIPVVTKETAIETSNYGVTLNSGGSKEIFEVANTLSQRPPEWCKDMSLRVKKVAASEFSEEAFLKNMKEGIECIIKKKQGG